MQPFLMQGVKIEEEHNIWNPFLALVWREVVGYRIQECRGDEALGRVGLSSQFALDL